MRSAGGHPRTSTPTTMLVAWLWLVAVVALACAAPVVFGLLSALTAGQGTPAVPVDALLSSFAVAASIGALATLLGWVPGAWIGSTPSRARWTPALLGPTLLPMSLAYTGWSVLRAPGWWMGDALARLAEQGDRWATIFAGQASAALGLALWAAPIPACLIARARSGRHPDLERELAMSPRRRTPLALLNLREQAPGALLGGGLVTLLMLGSAVPLHLAQLDTMAIGVWRSLAETAPGSWGRSWRAAWPLLLVSIAAGVLLARLLLKRATEERAQDAEARPYAPEYAERARVRACLACGVFVLAWGAPAVLAALAMRDPLALLWFWRDHADAFVWSAVHAGAAGCVAVSLGLAASLALSAERAAPRLAVGAALAVSLAAALTPGVLIGAGLSRIGTHLGVWSEPLMPVLALVSRTAFLGIVAACWVAWSESAAARDQRRLLGQDVPVWWASLGRVGLPVFVASGFASAALGLHEIEASIMVQSPGRPLLAQRVLDALHYLRQDETSAATLWLSLTSAALAIGVVLLLRMTNPRIPRTTE